MSQLITHAISTLEPENAEKCLSMQRYIERTGNFAGSRNARYQAKSSELSALYSLCLNGSLFEALVLAYDYGRAKGYREAVRVNAS